MYFYGAKLRNYLHICKLYRRIALIYRRLRVQATSLDRPENHAILARYLQTMKNTSRGVWGHGNECPQRKTLPAFRAPGGLGGWRQAPHSNNVQALLACLMRKG